MKGSENMAEKKTKKPKKAPVSKQPKKQEEPKSNKIKVKTNRLILIVYILY